MQEKNFNLTDILTAIKNKWKTITIIVLLALITATITLFIVPKKYKAQCVSIVQNPLMADKAKLFNNNIQNLYSILGNGDDLDVVYNLSKLDIVYYQLVDEFNLINYYNVEGKTLDIKRRKALLALQEDLKITKSETNLLKVIAYATDASFAAKLANRATALIQFLQEEVWKKSYELIHDHLIVSIDKMEKQIITISDTLRSTQTTDDKKLLLLNKRQTLLDEIQKYRKEAIEFQLMIETVPPALFVIDKSSPSTNIVKPDKLLTLITVFFIALFFAVILALIIERKKTNA
ncbi:MAG: hypothetical protein JST94_11840 [Bacteroidetes bacterium]|nr:hypothetical protein [Bacteroidota bacterium]MBS1672117.1 hypothetical protein [Bacteroidota bacterium]